MESDRMTARRKFLLALAAGAVWRPLQAIAQRAGSTPSVGVLALGIEGRADLLREGLRKLGYVEGRNIRLEEPPRVIAIPGSPKSPKSTSG